MGILLYCKEGGQTTCCVYAESCYDDYYKGVHGDLEKKSARFLKYPDYYINFMVEELSYDSCHRIDGLDATECARDCEKLAKTEFAQKCEQDNGLFKCCIRYTTIKFSATIIILSLNFNVSAAHNNK